MAEKDQLDRLEAKLDELKEKKSVSLPRWAWGLAAFLVLVGGGVLLTSMCGGLPQ